MGGVIDFIEIKMRERVLYCIFISRFLFGFFIGSRVRGYFGVGSGTHYMYSLGDDDEMVMIL